MLDINAAKIEAELRALADGKEDDKPSKSRVRIKVKTCKSLKSMATPTLQPTPLAMRSRETDAGLEIIFNPKRYRTPEKLEGHLNSLRRSIVWGS